MLFSICLTTSLFPFPTIGAVCCYCIHHGFHCKSICTVSRGECLGVRPIVVASPICFLTFSSPSCCPWYYSHPEEDSLSLLLFCRYKGGASRTGTGTGVYGRGRFAGEPWRWCCGFPTSLAIMTFMTCPSIFHTLAIPFFIYSFLSPSSRSLPRLELLESVWVLNRVL